MKLFTFVKRRNDLLFSITNLLLLRLKYEINAAVLLHFNSDKRNKYRYRLSFIKTKLNLNYDYSKLTNFIIIFFQTLINLNIASLSFMIQID